MVKFGADWCPPCKKIAPVLEELAKEGKWTYVSVDVDNCGEFATESGISSIPDVRFFKEGKEQEKFVGYKDKDAIKAILDKNGF